MRTIQILACALALLWAPISQAHPGGTDANGCHGGSRPFHCHGGSSSGGSGGGSSGGGGSSSGAALSDDQAVALVLIVGLVVGGITLAVVLLSGDDPPRTRSNDDARDADELDDVSVDAWGSQDGGGLQMKWRW